MHHLYRTLSVQATAVLLALLSPEAGAHSSAELHLRVQARGDFLELQTAIELHVLREMIPVDRDEDGRMSPAEIEQARPDLAAYLRDRLRFRQDGQACPVELVDAHMSNVSSLKLLMRARCPTPPARLVLDCGLLAGTRHRMVMFVELVGEPGVVQLRLDDRHRRAEIDLGRSPPWPRWLHVLVVALALAGLALALAALSYRRSPS